MSTYLYLQCLDHDPLLRSDGEVGQHMTDLQYARSLVKDRKNLAYMFDATVWAWPGGTNVLDQWKYNAARFFSEHKWCSVGIVDEYGLKWPLESPEDRIGKVFVDYVGNRWWLDNGKYLTCAPLNSDGTVDIENAGVSVNGSNELWTHLDRFLRQAEKEQPSW